MSWQAGKDYDMIFGWAFDRAANVRKDGSAGEKFTINDVLADTKVLLDAASSHVLQDAQPADEVK